MMPRRTGWISRYRLRLLMAALTVLVSAVSGSTRVAAQRSSPPLIDPAGAAFEDLEQLDFRSGTSNRLTSRWTGPLFADTCGMLAEPVYYGEVFSNTRGGI